MSITKLVIGILLFSGVMVGFGTIYADTVVNYPYLQNSTSLSNFTKFNQSLTIIENKTKSLEEKVTGFKEKEGLAQYYSMLLAVADIGGILIGFSNIITGFLGRTLTLIPYVPPWFSLMLGIIIISVVILRLVSIYMKTEEV